MTECVFCREYEEKYDRIHNKSIEVLLENSSFWVKYDPNPASRGHVLIISKKHVKDARGLSLGEFMDLGKIMLEAMDFLDENFHPDGYIEGSNVGKASGQTEFHYHKHIIPRYSGDVEDPTGGIRNVIPGKGNYRKKS